MATMTTDEFMLGHGDIPLPDTVLRALFKQYISEKDSLALVLSGVSKSYTELFTTNRRRLVISQCFFLILKPWESFFKTINHSFVTVFDCSSLYWFPAQDLCSYIMEMPNLTELKIQDTKISLENLPLLFKSCKQIVKLSLSLAEKNLDEYLDNTIDRESLVLMKEGFARVIHLEIFTCMVLSDRNCFESWLATLQVLSWCRVCVELLIKIGPHRTIRNSRFANIEDIRTSLFNETLRVLRPRLDWTNTLRSLVILRSRAQSNCRYEGEQLITAFLNFITWPSRNNQHGSFTALERLWVDEERFTSRRVNQMGENYLLAPTVKSIVLREESSMIEYPFVLNNERFRHLEHLADVIISRFERLADLKYIRGMVVNLLGLDQFCLSHPKLEELRFNASSRTLNVKTFGLKNWKLLLLKVLVYNSHTPSQGILEHLIKACPNIDQFHTSCCESLNKTETAHFFASIRFKYLTWLSIRGDMFDGSYLPLMVQQCPKLERLHLKAWDFDSDTFFLHLALCLPNAVNLRDLRLEWKLSHGDMSRPLFFLFSLLENCPRLQRLALIVNLDGHQRDFNNYAEMGDFLVDFVKKKEHLIALCLAGFEIDPTTVEHLRKRLADEILPRRQPFWFNLGPQLPKVNDTSVPRMHYDEIVKPIDPYYAPPRF